VVAGPDRPISRSVRMRLGRYRSRVQPADSARHQWARPNDRPRASISSKRARSTATRSVSARVRASRRRAPGSRAPSWSATAAASWAIFCAKSPPGVGRCGSVQCLTPYRRRTVAHANFELFALDESFSGRRRGSRLGAERGQSMAPIHNTAAWRFPHRSARRRWRQMRRRAVARSCLRRRARSARQRCQVAQRALMMAARDP
jgi:hypothetical protein